MPKLPCSFDANGECLTCDCWPSDCAYKRYIKRDFSLETEEQLEGMFKLKLPHVKEIIPKPNNYLTVDMNNNPIMCGDYLESDGEKLMGRVFSTHVFGPVVDFDGHLVVLVEGIYMESSFAIDNCKIALKNHQYAPHKQDACRKIKD